MQLSFDFSSPTEEAVVEVVKDADDKESATRSCPSVPKVQAEGGEGRGADWQPNVAPMYPRPKTLAEVERWLAGRADRSTRKVTDMRSALNGVGRVLGRKLDDVPADPAVLGGLLGKATPATVPMSREQWSAVKSRLRCALGQAGFEVMPGRSTLPLRPQWKALAESLPDQRSRVGLSRLISHLSRQGVLPDQVSIDDITAFEVVLFDRSLKGNTSYLYRTTVRIWNKAAADVDGWPAVVVPLEADPRKYSVPWDTFPQSFKADVDAFLTRSVDQDVFSDDYAPSIRPSTNENRRKHLHELASALVLSGFPAERLVSLADLVAPENATIALRWHRDRNDGETSSHISGMAYLLLTVARHWVRDKEAAEKLQYFCSRLKLVKKGMVEKNRTRLRQFDHPDNKAAFLHLPADVFARATKTKSPDAVLALRVMMALAVEILTVAPMRVGNLTQIEIGRHLIEFRRGKNRSFHLIFTPDETKTREPFEMEIPRPSADLLDVYLKTYRPLLPGADSSLLFPVASGRKRSTTAFATSISKFIERETGLKVNVHMFRHLAGKLYLDANPHDIETVRRILGHTTTTTTLNNYAELRSDHAFRRYDQVVTNQRDSHSLATKVTPPRRAGISNAGTRI